MSLLSSSAAAAAANERDAIHHAAGYQTSLGTAIAATRVRKLVSPAGAQIVQRPGTAVAFVQHGRERVILRNYCSGSLGRNARPTDRPAGSRCAVNRRRCDRERSDDDDEDSRGRGKGQKRSSRIANDYIYSIRRRLVLTPVHRQTDRQRQIDTLQKADRQMNNSSKFGRLP